MLISNPLQMRDAYSASKTAVQTCENIFIFNENNDESDACRHFVWSALLIDKMKAEDAKQILNAHEAEATQPADELKMDQKNNDSGLKAGEKLKSDDSVTPDAALEEFQKAFKNKELHVLKPSPQNWRKK